MHIGSKFRWYIWNTEVYRLPVHCILHPPLSLFLSGIQFSGPHSVHLSCCVDAHLHGQRLEQGSGGIHTKESPFSLSCILTTFSNLLAIQIPPQ